MLAQQNKFLIQSNSRDGREFNLAWKNPRRRRDFSRVVNARGEEFVLFFFGNGTRRIRDICEFRESDCVVIKQRCF